MATEQRPVNRIGQVDHADDGERDRVHLHRRHWQLDQAVPDPPPGRPVSQPPVEAAEDADERDQGRVRAGHQHRAQHAWLTERGVRGG
jgi:hypothetical protein